MKRLILLGILCFISVCAGAQIKRTIMGVTLGVTSRADFIYIMQSSGYDVWSSGGTIHVNGYGRDWVPFGGAQWLSVCAEFNADRLSEISFSTCEQSQAKAVGEALEKKYQRYYKPGAFRNYSDGKTSILFMEELQCLIYFDVKLKKTSNADDL